jgi:membrane protein implicated in regulation of membrane protease activity
MSEMPPFESPTLRNHRRQRFWQIFFPFLVVAVLLLAAGVFAALGGARVWADVSLIWLVVPLLIFALLFLALLVGMIYLVARLTRGVPPITAKAQFYGRRISGGVRGAADKAVQPILWLEQIGATFAVLFRSKGE